MASLLLLLSCLGAGLLLGRRLDAAPLQHYVLNLALPALALHAVHRLPALSPAGVASVWAVFGAALLFFGAAGRLLGWDRATVGALVLACGLSNTSFVGFPLLEAILGPEAVPVAVPLDQLGSFLLVCTAAPAVGAWAAGRSLDGRALLLRILRFPALWAMGAGLLLRGLTFPPALDEALARLAATLSPVALVAVGAQLRLPARTDHLAMGLGLGFKLLAAPAGVAAVLGYASLDARVAVLEAAMAPMVTGALLAQAHGLRPELASALLGLGVPLSLGTVWAWDRLLG